MDLYKEFIKGGEFLIAPSSEFKELYVLKCNVCEEFYSRFETFLSHHLTHYASEEDDDDEPQSPSGALYELYGDMDDNEMPENLDDSDGIQCVDKSKDLSNGDCNKCDASENSLKNIGNKDDNIQEPTDLNGQNEKTVQSYSEDSESDSNEPDESKTSDFIDKFMQSKRNVLRLIELYKKQSLLWNTNIPLHIKSKTERKKCLQKIADDLEKYINIKITYKQLHTILFRLRGNYRTLLATDNSAEIQKDASLKQKHKQGSWLCHHLRFLKPFLEKNPLAVVDDSLQELTPTQVQQILGIYQRCPYLWNTSLMENHCHNKRAEGIKEMQSLIKLEMNMEVPENSLLKYISCVNKNFSREKRQRMGIAASEEEQSEYYEHLVFLYDHVGPFQCTECQRIFISLLKFKVHEFEHDGRIRLKCSMCRKGFKTVRPYLCHIRRHMNDLPNNCKECGKNFLKTSELRSHMQIHADVKAYCCEICGISFRQYQSLYVHRMRHKKKYAFFCSTCSKGFYKKCDLDNHSKTHQAERDFVCPVCGKAFKTKKNMREHKLAHDKPRTHVCAICDNAFKSKLYLKQHLKLHLEKETLNTALKSKMTTRFSKRNK